MFTQSETECTPFKTAKNIINKNLLFSGDTINTKYSKDLFTAGEEIAKGASLSNNLKVQYFYLLLTAYSNTQQEQNKELYKGLIQLYRKACSQLVNELITKEICELKHQNQMTSKLGTLNLGS